MVAAKRSSMDAFANQSMLEISYGRMALRVHSVERNLVLIIAARLGEKEQNYDSLIRKYKKLTLGKLVSVTRGNGFFDQELDDHLKNLVKARNELVHEVGDIVSDSIFSGDNPGEVIEYITSFTRFLNSILEVLKHELVLIATIKELRLSDYLDSSGVFSS
jgi:uncharacterized protein YutE (UPF0331/DUF86 family)